MNRGTLNRSSCGQAPRGGRLGAALQRLRAAAAAAGLFAAALAGGCTKDITEPPTPGPGPVKPEAGYATMQLMVPGVCAASTYAASPQDETTLKAGELHALVYSKNAEGNWIFRYVATPDEVTAGDPGENGYRTYYVKIPFKGGDNDNTFRVGLVAGITLDELKRKAGYQAAADGEDEQWPGLSAILRADDGAEHPDMLAEVRSSLTFEAPARWPLTPDFKVFPMWGQSDPFVLRPQGTVVNPIQLVRAVARVDVGVKFRKNDDGKFPLDNMRAEGLYEGGRGTYFELTSVSVFRTAASGTYGAGLNASVEGADENTPPVPYDPKGIKNITSPGEYKTQNNDAGNAPQYGTDALAGITEQELPANNWSAEVKAAELKNRRCLTRTCYVPETQNKGLNFADAACVVVGGRYGSPDAEPTYYRIDFATLTTQDGSPLKPTPELRLDLLRNTVYVVNITSVSGPGAKDEDEALNSETTKLTAEVEGWNQSQQVGDIVTDGVYMLSVDKAEYKYYCDGTAESFVVKTDYQGELGSGWTLEVPAELKECLLYYDAQGKAHTADSPDFPTKGRVGTTELRLGMTELANKDGKEATRSGDLIFTAGRMQTKVKITQTSKDLLRILFDPAELYFGPKDPEPKSVNITVTTKKDYKLTLTGKDEDGHAITKQLHPKQTGDNNAGNFKTFFVKGTEPEQYEVLPQPLSEEQDNRQFSFELTVELADNTAGVPPVTETFNVYQLKEPIEWTVQDGAGKGYELARQKPYQVIVENTAQTALPYIETTPGTFAWWFSKRESSTGDYSWITNLEEKVGKRFEGPGGFTAGGSPFTLQPNTGLARRSVTLQVESNIPGLNAGEAQLILTQRGAPLKLVPEVQPPFAVDEKKTDAGKPYYEIDYQKVPDPAGIRTFIGLTSNTNWYWAWKDNRDQALLFDTWQPKPAENEVTTDHPLPGKSEYSWGQWISFTPAEVANATPPDPANQEVADMPAGGRRKVVLEMRNAHPDLTEEDVLEYARELHVTRELPAYTHIEKWPFYKEGDSYEAGDARSLDLAYENGTYDDEDFRAWSNAPMKLTLSTGATEESAHSRKLGEVEFSKEKGYLNWTQIFAQLPGMDGRVNEDSHRNPAQYYQLTFEGENRPEGVTANQQIEESRLYYTGYELRTPLRNMETGQYYLSSDAHNLKLDFKNSRFKRMNVRVKAVLVNTDGTEEGVQAYCDHNNVPADKRTIWLWPTNTENDGQEIRSDGQTLIQIALPENTQTNMMYKIVAEAKTQTGWEEFENLKIYQDGIPAEQSGVIWKYSPQDWGWTQLGNIEGITVPESNLMVNGAANMKWEYPTPLKTESLTWVVWQKSFAHCISTLAINKEIVGPTDITGRYKRLTSHNTYWMDITYDNGWGYKQPSDHPYIYYRRTIPPYTATRTIADPTVNPDMQMIIKNSKTTHEGIIGAVPGQSWIVQCSADVWVGDNLILRWGPAGCQEKYQYQSPQNYQHFFIFEANSKHWMPYMWVYTNYSEIEKMGSYPQYSSTTSINELYSAQPIKSLRWEIGKFEKQLILPETTLQAWFNQFAGSASWESRLQSATNLPNNAVYRKPIEQKTTNDLHPQE